MDYAGEEGLIDSIGKEFGDLDNIFCPLSGDETDSITDVKGEKLF
jgi:hypothetical protein